MKKKISQAVKKKASVKRNKEAGSKPGATPIRFSSEKQDLIRQNIVSVLWKNEELTPDKLKSETEKLSCNLLGQEFERYYNRVMELLVKLNIVETVKTNKVSTIRLIQRLE